MAFRNHHAQALTTVVRAILHLLPLHFVRRRRNGPRQALLMLLASIQSGVDRSGVRATRMLVLRWFGCSLDWLDAPPSPSSICRALRKLTVEMLEPVVERALSEVTRALGDRVLVDGRRIVAIDAVRINTERTTGLARWLHLPKLGPDTKAHQPQAVVVTAVCVISGVLLAQTVLPCTGSERKGARILIDRLQVMGPMILLLDRGYPSRAFIGLLCRRKIPFVMRMMGGARAWKDYRGCDRHAQADECLPIRITDEKGRFASAPLRCIVTPRAKPGRPRCDRTPKQMVLLTNLLTWKAESIIALYRRRWDSETVFRENKRLLGATHFRARTVTAFRTELFAYALYRILMALTIAAATATEPAQRWDDLRAKRHSTPQAIVAAWMLLEAALSGRPTATQMLALVLDELRRDRAKRRPGRIFRRECKGAEGRWKSRDESWRD